MNVRKRKSRWEIVKMKILRRRQNIGEKKKFFLKKNLLKKQKIRNENWRRVKIKIDTVHEMWKEREADTLEKEVNRSRQRKREDGSIDRQTEGDT